jgi:hypothetical protein
MGAREVTGEILLLAFTLTYKLIKTLAPHFPQCYIQISKVDNLSNILKDLRVFCNIMFLILYFCKRISYLM